ncbi:MAG: crotonase/enoyl-CoA hydratase family protein [Sandaracinaceae bacterium]
MSESTRVKIEIERGLHVLTLARPEKRNAFDLRMLGELAEGLTAYEDDTDARCAVLLAEGDHFTAGLDLAEVGPAVRAGAALFPDGGVDPLNLHGRRRKKPLVMAVQGWCLTIGIELLLAADVRIAAEGSRFGQIEINRGIFPFGGATVRLPQVAGWANAMRWLLTGDIFDAAEAERIGLVSDVVAPAELRAHALQIARTIARRAPLGVQATLASAETTLREGPDAAAEKLLEQARALMETEDAAEGLRSFVERREAEFTGK